MQLVCSQANAAMINTTFTESTDYHNGIEVHAKGVFVGVLLKRGNESLSWYAGAEPSIVRYSLSDENKFAQVINAIKDYYHDNGYNELIIGNVNGDIGTWHDAVFWKKYGFTTDDWPTFYRLIESRKYESEK